MPNKRGRPAKQTRTTRQPRETSRETVARHTGADRSRPRGGNYGGREKKEYTQVTKLFESKFKQDQFGGKVQREKLQEVIDRLTQILEDGQAARFNIDLNGKWGPYMSVTNADEYESKGRGSRGGSRGGNRGRGRQQESQDSDWGSNNDDNEGNDNW
jgi:hypothetical protein